MNKIYLISPIPMTVAGGDSFVCFVELVRGSFLLLYFYTITRLEITSLRECDLVDLPIVLLLLKF